jgi:Zn-dependent protease with chaperone function
MEWRVILVELLIVLALPYVLMKLAAKRVMSSHLDPPEKMHRLNLSAMWIILILVVALITFRVQVDVPRVHKDALRGISPSVAEGTPFAIVTLAFWAGALVALAMILLSPILRNYLALKGAEPRKRGGMFGAVIVLVAMVSIGVVFFEVFFALPEQWQTLMTVLIMFLVLTALKVAVGPLLFLTLTKRAEGAIRERVTLAARRLDVPIRDVRILKSPAPISNAMTTGAVPGFKYVIVTESLETLSPDEFDAVLAHEFGHMIQHHLLIKLLTPLVILLLAATLTIAPDSIADPQSAIGGFLTGVLPILLLMFSPVINGLLSITLEKQADDFAAQAVGPDPVASALGKIASDNLMKMDTGKVWNLLNQHPGIGNRILRLKKRFPSRPRRETTRF